MLAAEMPAGSEPVFCLTGGYRPAARKVCRWLNWQHSRVCA